MKIFNLLIDALDVETGIFAVSLVDCPAVETNFLKFKKDEPVELHFLDDAKHIITGVSLRADYPIYRNNKAYGEHYVLFTKETIRDLVEKFGKYNMYNNVNLNHDDNNFVNSVTMIESYFIDKERGICPAEFKDIEDGSWITSYKVDDIDLWKQIKEGNFNGFSIEGMFRYSDEPVEMSNQKDEIEVLVDEILSEN